MCKDFMGHNANVRVQVLRFYGYYQEHVVEDPRENARVRPVVFFFYLEDGTLQVSEPKVDNSGLPQVRAAAQCVDFAALRLR